MATYRLAGATLVDTARERVHLARPSRSSAAARRMFELGADAAAQALDHAGAAPWRRLELGARTRAAVVARAAVAVRLALDLVVGPIRDSFLRPRTYAAGASDQNVARSELTQPVVFRPMAVATDSEYGLFINGETVEPASGETRDLDRAGHRRAARARRDGRRGRHRPRRRGRARRARRRRGARRRRTSAPACCTRSPTRSSRTARSSPSSSRATSARRSPPSRPRSPAPSRTSASSPPRSARSPAARTRSAARCSPTR